MKVNWLPALVLFVVLYFVAKSFFGIAGMLTLTLFILGVMGLIKLFNLPFANFVPINVVWAKYLAIVGLGLTVILPMLAGAGVKIPVLTDFGNQITSGEGVKLPSIPGGSVAVPVVPGQTVVPAQTGATPVVTSPGCTVTSELYGKSSTVDINAWNLESDTPYSAAVDVDPTYVWVNGIYKSTLTDTSGNTLNAAVGDIVTVKGGSATYYEDAAELCVSTERPSLNVGAHAVVADADISVVAYDDSGETVLDAGTRATNNNCDDYNLTMGAGETTTVYAKWKVNVANEALRVGGVATISFYNITHVKPIGSDEIKRGTTTLAAGTYASHFTPTWLKAVNVRYNDSGSSNTINKDYTPYKRSAPVLLHEWETIKIGFEVKSDTSNDPIDSACNSNPNGFAVMILDSCDIRGDDGQIYDDFYAHTSAQGSVCLDEDEARPYGRTTGFIVNVK